MSQRNLIILMGILLLGILYLRLGVTRPKQIEEPSPDSSAAIEKSREIIRQFRTGASPSPTAPIPNPASEQAASPQYPETTQPTIKRPRSGWEWYDTNVVHASPQTNTFAVGTREITLVTKYGVNTNTVFDYLREMTDQDAYVAVRLAELAVLANNLKIGMKPPEVLAVLGEEPVKFATNHLGVWALYSPHPLRKLPSLGNKFAVFEIRFDPSGNLEKWWFDTRH